MGLGIALRAFSAGLLNKQTAEQLRRVLDGQVSETPRPELPPPAKSQEDQDRKPRATRSEAVTLLAALQREARLVDLVQEDLEKFSDAQVGAAARPCLQQCASTLERLMGLAAVSDAGEGAMVDIGDDGSPTRYQWIGEGTTTAGKLVHHGWLATKVELPQWTGSDADVNVIAPAQIQR